MIKLSDGELKELESIRNTGERLLSLPWYVRIFKAGELMEYNKKAELFFDKFK